MNATEPTPDYHPAGPPGLILQWRQRHGLTVEQAAEILGAQDPNRVHKYNSEGLPRKKGAGLLALMADYDRRRERLTELALEIRLPLTVSQIDRWSACAHQTGQPLDAWILQSLEQASKKNTLARVAEPDADYKGQPKP